MKQTDYSAKVINFKTELVPGNVKAAMREANASSRDLWYVDIGSIRILPNFNVRTKNEGYRAHIRGIANSMKQEGWYPDKPAAGYVALEGDEQVIYITDGHCRYDGAQIAISEGAEISKIPVVVSAKGTSMEDLTVALVKSNKGKELDPYETAIVCKRLSRFGWEPKQIAERLDYTEQYVEDLLSLMAAPKDIRDMVEAGEVSASNAIAAIRRYGEKALEHLQAALGRAKAGGAGRVTAKHLPGARFTKEVKKAAPKLFDTLKGVKSDPAYQSISPELREQLDALLDELEKAKTDGQPVAAAA